MKNINKRLSVRFIIIIGLILVAIVLSVLLLYRTDYLITISILIALSATFLYGVIFVVIPLIKIEKQMMKYVNNLTHIDILQKTPIIQPFMRFIKKVNEEYYKSQSADILKKQAEINYLQGQINPHFLYNCLESIRGNAVIVGADGIAEMTEALATFFRYGISTRGNLVTVEEEIDNVKNYFLIQQYRFNNRFNITYLYDSDVMLSNYYLPKLTLQPLVENAIFHGLETKTGEGNIEIRIEVTEERLIINVKDDGIGISKQHLEEINKKIAGLIEEKKSDFGGVALSNVNRRIKLNFGEEYGIYLTSVLNYGTSVEVVLPLVNSKDAKNFRIIEK